MIIDTSKPEFKDLPETLNGEVLLERTYDGKGNLTGFLTASIDVVKAQKGKTDAELEKSGWLKYKKIIEGIK